MKKRMSILLASLLLLLFAFGGIAFAWPEYVDGRPSEFRAGNAIGYYIWRDHSGFNLRTTSPRRGHIFTGSIQTDGHFTDVRQMRNEQGDYMRLSPDGKRIHFRFTTPTNDTDGIDFQVHNGSQVSFELSVDGSPAPARMIHLGAGSRNPNSSQFTINDRAASAWPDFLNGRPSEFRAGNAIGYYIWRDHSGFNLRTTSPRRGHIFTGSIQTDGQFTDVRQLRNEQGDYMRLSPDGKRIHFRFTTPVNDTDGIDFQVHNGSQVSFELSVDGNPAPARMIHIGAGSRNPNTNQFTIHRSHHR